MARRGNRKGIFNFILIVLVASLCAGGVAAWVTSYNIKQRAQGQPGLQWKNINGPVNTIEAASLNTNVKKLTRPELESEVIRLNETLAQRNQQVDELQIQLKIATEGSRSSH